MAVELTGPADGPLDEPLALRVRGAGPGTRLTWRARVRDDDGRVWRATADTAGGLDETWAPAKSPAAPHAALASLRPVRVDVRVETPEGHTATRTVTRHLLADGVRVRRWKGEITASLVLPAEPAAPPVVLDDPDALLAAALLASRGVMTLVLKKGDPDVAAAQLEGVPGGAGARMLGNVPIPPGVPGSTAAAAWDTLLADLGARPRQAVAGDGSA